MSQENVEIVLKGIRHFEEGDFEAISGLWAEDARITSPAGWPEAGPFEGRRAVIDQFRRLTSDMGHHHFREVEVVADRDDWVVVRFLWEVRGAESGAAVETRVAAAYRVRGGKLVEAHFTWTPGEALEAAGLAD